MAVRDGTLRGGTIGRRLGQGTRPRLLPSGTGEFFRRRLIEFAGLALFALALAILAACLTFDAGDASFNRAVDAPARNLLGQPGAYGADMLLHSLGLAALVFPLVLAVWGWRLMRRHAPRRWWLRLALLPVLLLLAGAALAAVPTPPTWPVGDSLGGFTGTLLLGRGALLSALEPNILAWVAAALALGCFYYVLGLTRAEWRAAGRAVAWSLNGVGHGLSGLAQRPAQAVRGAGGRRDPRLRTSLAPHAAEDDEIESFARSPGARSPGARGPERNKRSRLGLVALRKTRAAQGKRGRHAAQRRLDFGPGGDYERSERRRGGAGDRVARRRRGRVVAAVPGAGALRWRARACASASCATASASRPNGRCPTAAAG